MGYVRLAAFALAIAFVAAVLYVGVNLIGAGIYVAAHVKGRSLHDCAERAADAGRQCLVTEGPDTGALVDPT